MASQDVSGKTQSQIEEMRSDWNPDDEGMPFEERYCLAKIPVQPDSYEGPQRYCVNSSTNEMKNGNHRCRFHGGDTSQERNTDEIGGAQPAMKHGMHATQENLVEDFDDKDKALYDWIMESYPEHYDLALDQNPSLQYDLHRLAVEIVRAERGRGFLISEGEVVENEKVSDEGQVVIGEDGEIVTEKSEHYLSQMLHRQDKKITQLEKELGITRKEQRKHENEEDAVEAMKNFAELGTKFLDRESKTFDPDDEPWSEDEDSD